MRFFTKYSLFANIFSIVVIVIAILYISYKALQGGGDPEKFSPKDKVELTAFNFHYNKYDKDGDLTLNFVTDKLERFVNEDVRMTDLFETSYDKETGKKSLEVKSKHGFSSKSKGDDLIRLYDGVNAIMYSKDNKSKDDNNKPADGNSSSKYSPNKIYIKTSEMYYNNDSKDFYNDRFVRMYDPNTGNNTTAIGVKGNSESKVINLKKNVRSYYASS
ncbi:hypothetical protein LO80_00840 [Candidatus Francisella endociliophora]|uniref:LPS export ABC transporter periplasmic protein LptC n=1 Tax=Candidatus Francisella endociliophora TaxID=653937 RepID=A0A097EM91_9GAMM|nr:LPS export ABC transporter periplasmic protein LptC [Francisella sp. FSC1006]AIT08663.1 hypothetical protein LO80_00840 [Francisella sp. FSC1006]